MIYSGRGIKPIRAAVVAGGRGVRMGPATDRLPKPMLPVEGRPLLEHQLLWFKESGVEEVFLCLGYKAEAFSSHFGDGSRLGLRLSYLVEDSPRGTAGAVRDLGAGAGEDLLVVYGDLYIEMDLGRLLAFHAGHRGAATLVLCETDHPGDSDLAAVEGDRITRLYRSGPGEPEGRLALAAVWVVRRRLLEAVPADRPSDFGRDVFPAALARGETLMGYRTRERLLDLGTPERLEAFLRSRRQR